MHQFYLAVIFSMINLAWTANETIRSEILALGLSSGEQLFPAPNYTLRWSSYEAPSYIIALKPATEEDVAKIVTSLLRALWLLGQC